MDHFSIEIFTTQLPPFVTFFLDTFSWIVIAGPQRLLRVLCFPWVFMASLSISSTSCEKILGSSISYNYKPINNDNNLPSQPKTIGYSCSCWHQMGQRERESDPVSFHEISIMRGPFPYLRTSSACKLRTGIACCIFPDRISRRASFLPAPSQAQLCIKYLKMFSLW